MNNFDQDHFDRLAVRLAEAYCRLKAEQKAEELAEAYAEEEAPVEAQEVE